MENSLSKKGINNVLAVGLDSMDLGVVDRLIGKGDLPNLARMKNDGCWAELTGLPHSLAETSQVLGITGCSPESTGYWSQNRFHPETMDVESPVLYDFDRQPPFFALDEDCPTVVFDLPQLEFHPKVSGAQVAGWGAHSPMSDLQSNPPELAAAILERFGPHPTADIGYALLDDRKSLEELSDDLLRGIDLRRDVVLELLQEEPWRLFVTWISETHQAGHYFWPHEDLCIGNEAGQEIVDEIYRKTDAALGAWMKAAGPNVQVIAYSLEGMKSNTDEFPSIVLLAEWALRRKFHKGALEFDPENISVSPERAAGINDWVMELWNQRKRTTRLQDRLRKWLTPRQAAKFDFFLGGPKPFQPELFGFLSYQHVMWISPYWSQMPVFALPSFSDGFLRINVKGREKPGIIPEKSFREFSETIVEELHSLECAETGKPVIERVIRIRETPHEKPESPADLVIIWKDPCPKKWRTPWGEISRGVSNRAGSHRPVGFMGILGPEILPGKRLEGGDVRDIAPTILARLGMKPENALEGRDLLN